MAALQQVFSPPPTPRYLLLRQARYYAVPTGCNENKTRAGKFAAAWRKRVGNTHLIYAHTRDGKLHLLKTREQALAEHFAYTVDIGSRWAGVGDPV